MKFHEIDFNSSEFDEFIEFPWKIYQNKYKWIPPLKESIKTQLSNKNPFFKHGKAQAFICRDDNGKILGRILASIDDNLVNKDVGYFGYFDCIDDNFVASKLLELAENYIKENGKTIIQGPVNLNVYTEYRIQTNGFQTEPFLGEPRSPEYYKDLVTSAGYQKFATWNSWDIPKLVFGSLKEYMESQIKKYPQVYTVKKFDLNDFDNEMKKLHPVALESFSENFGFSQIDLEEFINIYYPMKNIISFAPEMFDYFVDKNNEMVAFGFGFIDFAQAFIKMNGDIEKFSLISESQPNRAVFHTFGIKKEHRRSEISYTTFKVGLNLSIEKNFDSVIGALAKEGKTAYDQLGEPTRTYSVFQKELV